MTELYHINVVMLVTDTVGIVIFFLGLGASEVNIFAHKNII